MGWWPKTPLSCPQLTQRHGMRTVFLYLEREGGCRGGLPLWIDVAIWIIPPIFGISPGVSLNFWTTCSKLLDSKERCASQTFAFFWVRFLNPYSKLFKPYIQLNMLNQHLALLTLEFISIHCLFNCFWAQMALTQEPMSDSQVWMCEGVNVDIHVISTLLDMWLIQVVDVLWCFQDHCSAISVASNKWDDYHRLTNTVGDWSKPPSSCEPRLPRDNAF